MNSKFRKEAIECATFETGINFFESQNPTILPESSLDDASTTRHRKRSSGCRGAVDVMGEGVREGNGEPYGAFKYRGVSAIGGKCASPFSEPRTDVGVTGEDGLLSKCPSIGASDSTGEPGQDVPALLPVALLTTFT